MNEALLRELIAELHAMREATDRLTAAVIAGSRGAPRADSAELVERIKDHAGARPFSVTELLEHAQFEAELRAAMIKTVGAVNGKRLGKWLASIEGVDFHGTSIVRAGENREGVLWRVAVSVVLKKAKAVAGR